MTELGNKQLIEAHKWLKERAFEKEDVPILLVEYARSKCKEQREVDAQSVASWSQVGSQPKEYRGDNYQKIKETPLVV